MTIENAKITSVSLSMADHGCLTFHMGIKAKGWGTNYGGYCIGHGFLGADKFEAENGGGLEAMMQIMNVVDVEKWEDLPGHYIRVKTEGWGDKITTIGNIIKDKWFDIDEFFKEKDRQNNPDLPPLTMQAVAERIRKCREKDTKDNGLVDARHKVAIDSMDLAYAEYWLYYAIEKLKENKENG